MSNRKHARASFKLGAAPDQLREMLRDLARWAVASSLTAAVGCAAEHTPFDLSQSVPSGSDAPTAGGGGSSATPRTDTPHKTTPDGWTPIDCSNPPTPTVLAHVKFNDPLDYIAFYRSYTSGLAMSGPFAAGVSLIEEWGHACSSAGDQAGCQSSLSDATKVSDACVLGNTCTPFLLTTDQQGATRTDERSALISMLGAIDSESKAALVTLFDGHKLGCPFKPDQNNSFQGATPLRGTETKPRGNGYDVRTEWQTGCTDAAYAETVHVDRDGTLSVTDPKRMLAPSSCIAGRRPQGLCAVPPARHGLALGVFFAHAARLEGASVHAFARLARELAMLGAPSELIAQAALAALDEVRHTRATGELARRFGAEPLAAHVTASGERSAIEIAIENAVEGCVRETYGALIAHHQAQAATDPLVRAAMLQIAEDETRHAELSWRIARWLEPRLPPAAQHELEHARAAALAQLATELDAGFTPSEAQTIGWPAPQMAAAMLEQLGAALGIA